MPRMPDEQLLPELARSLRALGAPRNATGEAAHAAIFSPLLDARARAGTGDVETALWAFRGEALAIRIEARVADAAKAYGSDAAEARARAARATELVEPLRAELLVLDRLAAAARGAAPGSADWHAWVAHLRRVFGVADESCAALAQLLADSRAETGASRRWFGR